MKSDLLNAGKDLARLKLKDFPNEEIFARRVTLGERIAYQEARSDADRPFGQHEMIYLSVFNAEGKYYFDSAQEVAKLNSVLADEILVQILRASRITDEAEDDAEKK